MAEQDTTDPTDDRDLIESTRDFVRLVQEVESDNRLEAERDREYQAGEQWDARLRQSREQGSNPRPCLVINEIPVMLNQVVNDYIQNPPGVSVNPVDNDADPDTAQVIEGLLRSIKYHSSGEVADEVAFESAAAIGWGYFRLTTDYVDDKSFEQQILFDSIPNTLNVFFDPHSKAIDGSDARDCVIIDQMGRKEFKALYPDAEANSQQIIASQEIGDEWLTEDTVQVAERYTCESAPDTLLMLRTGQVVYASQIGDPALLQQHGGVVQERPVQRTVVKWYKLTAVDILEERTLPGRWIPVVPMYCSVIYLRSKKKRFGLIRFLRDPQLMLNYWETTKTELLALQPRAPWLGPEGFMGSDSMQAAWRTSNNSNVVALEYAAYDAFGRPISPPQRMPFPPPPTGVIEAAGQAREYMREISGISQPARITPGSSRSGASLRQEEAQADMATFHIFRSAQAAKVHACRIALSWIPTYYDTPRVLRIIGEDGRASLQPVNQPQQRPMAPGQPMPPGGMPVQAPDGTVQAVNTVLHDLTVGQYDVMLSSGPNYETKRQEAIQGMAELGRSFPKLWEVAGSNLVRNMDWPGAEDIAKKLAMTEPQLPEDQGQNAEEMLPRVMGQLQKVQQEAQMLNAHAQQMEQQLQETSAENQKLKADRSVKAAEVQVKQAELVVKQEELRLQASQQQMEYQMALEQQQTERLKLEVEREKLRASREMAMAQHEQNGKESGDA